MPRMAKDNKSQTVMVGTRISEQDNRLYKKLAAAEHRKLAEVVRMLLSQWASRNRDRSVA